MDDNRESSDQNAGNDSAGTKVLASAMSACAGAGACGAACTGLGLGLFGAVADLVGKVIKK